MKILFCFMLFKLNNPQHVCLFLFLLFGVCAKTARGAWVAGHSDMTPYPNAILVPVGALLVGAAALRTPQQTLSLPAAARLQEQGFATLPDTVDKELVRHARQACMQELDRQLAEVAAAGCDVLGQQYSFATICHRQQLRWDLRLPDTPEWQRLCAQALQRVEAAISPDAPLRVVMTGCVVSKPGAGSQSWHADGNADGLFTCFVPLVDIASDADGTQFWPGSHEDAHAPALAPTLQWDEERMEEVVAPACPAGGILVFDYRVIHRGLPNAGRDRPVAYLVVAAADDGAAEDAINFPPLQIAEARPADLAAFPRFDEDGTGEGGDGGGGGGECGGEGGGGVGGGVGAGGVSVLELETERFGTRLFPSGREVSEWVRACWPCTGPAARFPTEPRLRQCTRSACRTDRLGRLARRRRARNYGGRCDPAICMRRCSPIQAPLRPGYAGGASSSSAAARACSRSCSRVRARGWSRLTTTPARSR